MSDERRDRKGSTRTASRNDQPRTIPFHKMHGLGNDYVYLDAVTNPALERLNLPSLAQRVSDRHTGIGSDGLILVCKPTANATKRGAHVRMRMFNADGSESAMCGNGIRCVAKLAHDYLGVSASPMLVETGAGLLAIRAKVTRGELTEATVDMGSPGLELAEIPVTRTGVTWTDHPHQSTLHIAGMDLKATFVSMGNPHAVVFVEATSPKGRPTTKASAAKSSSGKASSAANLDAARDLMLTLGPLIEHHAAFPQRVNAHFVIVHSATHASMFTWERGSGATRACGTGACAVLVAGVLTGQLARAARLTLPGGDLKISWDAKTSHVFMTGPAELSFRGEIALPKPAARKR